MPNPRRQLSRQPNHRLQRKKWRHCAHDLLPSMGVMDQTSNLSRPASPESNRPPLSRGMHLERDTNARLAVCEAHRLRLYTALVEEEASPNFSWEEVEVHFAAMPMRYWPRVDTATLRWHLTMIHDFIASVAGSDAASTTPVVRWQHFPDRGITEVAVATWDRQGLLAKVAGSFALVGLNIVRADIYTRIDDVVLDVFQVCTADYHHVTEEARLAQMAEMLEAALSAHGDQASLVVRQTEKVTSAEGKNLIPASQFVITFDNDRSDDYTILNIEAGDRIGLLYRILEVLSNSTADIAHAIITTDNGIAADVFYLTDSEGQKLRGTAVLEDIRQRLAIVLR